MNDIFVLLITRLYNLNSMGYFSLKWSKESIILTSTLQGLLSRIKYTNDNIVTASKSLKRCL